MATECGLPFLSIKGPELLGSYVGESEANIRAVFSSAREAAEGNRPAPAAAVLFFDELDSLAPRRGGVGDGGGVMERVVATLFAELDGGSSSGDSDVRLFVIAASNRPDLLDPSLLRPGRLDRLVYLGIANNLVSRAKVLSAQLRKVPLQGDPWELAQKVVKELPDRLTGADFSTIASGSLALAMERLCQQADEELERRHQSGNVDVVLEDVLDEWTDEDCTPKIQVGDLLQAAKLVVPSITRKELEHYERLREHYSSRPPTGPTEIEGDLFY